ncbi:MAG: metallophosphoesterase [Myxococcota bacterium]
MKSWMLALAMLATAASSGCALPECTNPDYSEPECRVIAENEFARLRTPSSIELRFQQPDAQTPVTWDARGLLQLDAGIVAARVAGAGRFALSVEAEDGAPDEVTIELQNVDPAADVWIDRGTLEIPVLPDQDGGLRRTVALDVEPEEPVFLRGRRGCPERYRVAFVADIQTNPAQFERILERLQQERDDGEIIDQPLVAIVIPGDLTEASRDDEFDIILEILESAPVPVVVTPGNHDIYRPLHPHFNRRLGPGNHVSEVCDLRLVMLDTGSGAIARSVETRLPELFDRGDAEHLIVAMHHPAYAGLTGAGWSREDRAQRLLAEAAIADVDLLVAGHAHALRDFASIRVGDKTLRQIVVGTGGAYQGLGEPRFGYVRVTLGPDGLDTCFVEVPPPGFDSAQGQGLSDRLDYCD